ncbi:Uncharacterised protein [Vibrio cholerae]|nr:Uncharacterised protein [Vibrio cholerae]
MRRILLSYQYSGIFEQSLTRNLLIKRFFEVKTHFMLRLWKIIRHRVAQSTPKMNARFTM